LRELATQIIENDEDVDRIYDLIVSYQEACENLEILLQESTEGRALLSKKAVNKISKEISISEAVFDIYEEYCNETIE